MRALLLTFLTALVLAGYGCSEEQSAADAGTTTEPADAEAVEPPDAAAGRDVGTRVDGGPRVYGAVAVADFCGKLSDALCSRGVTCKLVDPSLKALCLKRVTDACRAPFLQAAASGGKLTFDDKAAGQCVGEVGDAQCGLGMLSVYFEDLADRLPGCKNIVTGKGVAGDVCTNDNECAPGNFCNIAYQACAGKCAKYAQANEPCNFSDKQCDPKSLDCDWTTYTCKPLGKAGATCFWDGECAEGEGYKCINDKCALAPAPVKQGEACNTDNGYPTCAEGTYCRTPADYTQPGTCQPLVREGYACTGYGQCVGNLFCSAGYSVGKCEAKKLEGEACTGYDNCRSELSCTSGKCTRGPKVGEECPNYSCSEGYCDYYGTKPYKCAAKHLAGDSCSSGYQCESARCTKDGSDAGTYLCQPPCAP